MYWIKARYLSSTSFFVLSVTCTKGSLTSGDDNFKSDAAYFTGDGLLSINKALWSGDKSLLIFSAVSISFDKEALLSL